MHVFNNDFCLRLNVWESLTGQKDGMLASCVFSSNGPFTVTSGLGNSSKTQNKKQVNNVKGTSVQISVGYIILQPVLWKVSNQVLQTTMGRYLLYFGKSCLLPLLKIVRGGGAAGGTLETQSCHLRKPQHKSKSRRKQSYYWISIEPHITSSLLTTLDIVKKRKKI